MQYITKTKNYLLIKERAETKKLIKSLEKEDGTKTSNDIIVGNSIIVQAFFTSKGNE